MGTGQDIQERTLDFASRVIRLHDGLMKRRGSGRTIARQLLRSGTAVGALLEEADAAESHADFVSKCSIALKESRESLYWLRLLCRAGILPAEQVDSLTKEANEIVSIMTTIVRKTREGTPTLNS